MRKQFLTSQSEASSDGHNWLILEQLAQVEVTSEEDDHPIESALLAGGSGGWRASQAGPQIIRLRFDEPQRLRLIRLTFLEEQIARTQEFVLSWSAQSQGPYQEVVRQQYTFSPPGTTRQVEQYTVDLPRVLVLELQITPQLGGGPAQASLQELRLA